MWIRLQCCYGSTSLVNGIFDGNSHTQPRSRAASTYATNSSVNGFRSSHLIQIFRVVFFRRFRTGA